MPNLAQQPGVRTTQQLTMTPELRQSVRLLQMSGPELLQEVERQLESNPLLERQEAEPLVPAQPAGDADARKTAHEPIVPDTLFQHLLQQLRLLGLADAEFAIGCALIGALDERGYLCEAPEALAPVCRDLLGAAVPPDWPQPRQVLAVLRQIQQFDPAGVAARDLVECLQLQLEALPAATPWRLQAHAWLASMRSGQGLQALPTPALPPGMQGIGILLRQLDPAPGARFADASAGSSSAADLPDVIASRHHGGWQVTPNPILQPTLRIDAGYAGLIRTVADAAARTYLSSRLREARWLLRGLQNRQATLARVVHSILALQDDFFRHGAQAMKPLVLADVADDTGLHVSTVSRAIAGKFLLVPGSGLHALQYFFSSGVPGRHGERCSSTAIQARIRRLVASESACAPLSDSRLAQLLNADGIQVARRTLAKYREDAGIPSSRARKARPG
ncbi:RNA polymerase factor sigma-54 [Castellaniella sp.]|uniref:RNA polymerase factor sigma-54 n=1 Tax=Castellaniella sp. TaxID=1955812 RepID=UPI00355FDC10